MSTAVRSSSFASFTATGTEPAGAAQDDILVAYAFSFGAVQDLAGPAGWTKLVDAAAALNGRHGVWAMKRGASAPSYVWTSSDTIAGIHIWACSGADLTTWIDATPTLSNNASSNTPTSPSITTVTSAALLLVGIFGGTASSSPITEPSGFTADSGSAALDGKGAHKTGGAAGATGTFQWTLGGSAVETGTCTIAIRPVPDVPAIDEDGAALLTADDSAATAILQAQLDTESLPVDGIYPPGDPPPPDSPDTVAVTVLRDGEGETSASVAIQAALAEVELVGQRLLSGQADGTGTASATLTKGAYIPDASGDLAVAAFLAPDLSADTAILMATDSDLWVHANALLTGQANGVGTATGTLTTIYTRAFDMLTKRRGVARFGWPKKGTTR